jgi:hypothetical protein
MGTLTRGVPSLVACLDLHYDLKEKDTPCSCEEQRLFGDWKVYAICGFGLLDYTIGKDQSTDSVLERYLVD